MLIDVVTPWCRIKTHIIDCYRAKGWFSFPHICSLITRRRRKKSKAAKAPLAKTPLAIYSLLPPTREQVFHHRSYDMWWKWSHTATSIRPPPPPPKQSKLEPSSISSNHWNHCRADTNLCQPPCFGLIDKGRFGLTAEEGTRGVVTGNTLWQSDPWRAGGENGKIGGGRLLKCHRKSLVICDGMMDGWTRMTGLDVFTLLPGWATCQGKMMRCRGC